MVVELVVMSVISIIDSLGGIKVIQTQIVYDC